MFTEAKLIQQAFKDLEVEDCYRAAEALQTSRLASLREAREYRQMLTQLKQEYVGERRAIIGEENRAAYQELRLKQSQQFRSLRTELPKTNEGLQQLKDAKVKLGKDFEEFAHQKGIQLDRLADLDKSHQRKRETAYFETIGKGAPAESPGHPINCISPPFLGYTETESGPHALVEDWGDHSRGTMGGTMHCSLHDCDDDEDAPAMYRHFWLMAGQTETTAGSGHLMATIDLQPQYFYSAMSARDEFGYSGVDIRRHFRAFARLEMPDVPGVTGRRFYWQAGRRNQIIFNARGVRSWGHANYTLPFFYEESGFNLESFDQGEQIANDPYITYTGSPQGGGTWRYQMYIQDGDIDRSRLVLATVGIEIDNNLWGNDCSASSVVTFGFLTPRICCEVI